MFRKNRGFTLIELLVVISIIGVLSSTSLVAFQGVKQKAKDAKLVLDLFELRKALELYKAVNNTYPGVANTYYVSSGVCNATCQHGLGVDWSSVFDADFKSKYLAQLPTEYATCGILYVKFSGTSFANPGCKESNTGTFINPSGYAWNGIPLAEGGYEYLIGFTSNYTESAKGFPYLTWQGDNGGFTFSTNNFCILGPKR